MGLTYVANSKMDFRNFFIRKYFLLLFTDLKLLTFQNNIVKISEVLDKWNLVKTCIQTTYPIGFCIICSQVYYGRECIYRFYLYHWIEWIF